MRVHGMVFVIGAAVGALALVACGDDNPTGSGGFEGPAPDFSLTDVNPNSASFEQSISPRGFLGQASAWYFGHST